MGATILSFKLEEVLDLLLSFQPQHRNGRSQEVAIHHKFRIRTKLNLCLNHSRTTLSSRLNRNSSSLIPLASIQSRRPSRWVESKLQVPLPSQCSIVCIKTRRIGSNDRVREPFNRFLWKSRLLSQDGQSLDALDSRRVLEDLSRVLSGYQRGPTDVVSDEFLLCFSRFEDLPLSSILSLVYSFHQMRLGCAFLCCFRRL